jgi:regulatory protein
MIDEENSKKKQKKKKPPKEVTASLLREQALRYLDRFSATTHKLKRHLLTKNREAISLYGHDVETISTQIDVLISKLEKAGILNDQLYAESKARSMARQGKSFRQIEGKLYSLGITDNQKDKAIDELTETEGHSDRVGAAKFIRRRRFGPYKETPERSVRRDKELLSLVRNGFDYGLAQELLDIEDSHDIDDIIFNKLK